MYIAPPDPYALGTTTYSMTISVRLYSSFLTSLIPLNKSSKALLERVTFISVKVWFNSSNNVEVRLIAARLNLFPRNTLSATSLMDCKVLFKSRTVSIGTP